MPRVSRLLRPAFRAARVAATLGSAALAVAVLSIWAISFRRPVTTAFDARGERCRVVIDGGRAGVDNAPQVAADVTANAAARRARIDAARWVEEELRERTRPPAPPRPPWSDVLPPYAPPLAAVLLAVPPALAVRRRLRLRYRQRTGRCAACGYDCRATRDRCPECGAAPPAAA